jgi:5'-nucleotidase
MRILVTNDDGVFSPGLRELAEVSADFGDLRIVAPDVEQSSVAQAISASRPISYRPVKVGRFEAFRVNGTPADCVGLGIFVWGAVDLVLSGVNLGLNLGNAVWHSGTLAAAKQASLFGVRGIALSAPDSCEEEGYEGLRPYLKALLKELLDAPHLALLNVNLPVTPKGVRFTRQSVRHYDGRIERSRDPQGREIYWFAPRPLGPAEPGTDRWAIENDLISVTPLRLDLTDHEALGAANDAAIVSRIFSNTVASPISET